MAQLTAMTYMWLVWMEISVESTTAAFKARAAGRGEPIGERYLTARDDELKASMIAVSAAAHAIDAFYGTVAYEFDVADELRAAWVKNKTSRRDRILETLKLGFDVGGKAKEWAGDFDWLFDLRDGAVHHESEFKPVGDHPGGRLMVPQENIQYCWESAFRARDIAWTVIATCLRTAKAEHENLRAWAMGEAQRAEQLDELIDPGGELRRFGRAGR
jgi:hypothetical protein